MTKKIEKFVEKDWIKVYKDYVLRFGELVNDLKTLIQYADKPFIEFKTCFQDLDSLEASIMEGYFKNALHVLKNDENLSSHNSREQHLAFLYVLMEMISEDEVFLELFQREKMKDPSFMLKLQSTLGKIELSWGEIEGWKPEILEKLKLNPKQSILINHSLSCIVFYLKDKSNEKQDTDAYIEKTTDLLFKLSDTSTLNSMLDLGRFMFSRTKNAFC